MKVAQLALYGGMLKSQKGIDMKCRPQGNVAQKSSRVVYPLIWPHCPLLTLLKNVLLLLMSICIV